MKRKSRILLAGLASVGAVAGAGVLHNRRPDRRERLFATLYSEPGYTGRNETLTWAGGGRRIVPFARVQLARIGSIRLERFVYRFQPDVRPPNMRILWHALTERNDTDADAEGGVYSLIAIHQLAGMFSVGWWETVRESEARSGVRLWAGRPGSALPPHDDAVPAGETGPSEAASDGEAGAPGAHSWHDVMADVPDVGPWSTRTRYLELGYHAATGPRG
jgi:hypothetical protein